MKKEEVKKKPETEVKKKPTTEAKKASATETKKTTEVKKEKVTETKKQPSTEVKKKATPRAGMKKKEENKTVKIVILIIIAVVSMVLGWLFATLMDNTCDVTFSTGNGFKDIVVSVEKNNGVVRPADPEKEGYRFEGWYYEGVKFDFSNPITKNMTITAIWSEESGSSTIISGEEPEITTYTVTFDSNGGSEVATQTIEENKLSMEPTNPTRSGYTFNGWYLGDEKFDFTTKVTENITLTAKWTKDEEKTSSTSDKETVTKYTVKFNYGYSNKVTSKSVEKGKTVSKPSNPTRSGYTFLGWYYNGAKFDFSTKITKNITLTAKWEKKDVITWKSVKIEGGLLPQVRIYIVKNGKYVAGTADVVDTQGKTVTRNIPASGWVTMADTVKTLKNIKVN